MNVPVKCSFKLWPFLTVIFQKCWFLWLFYGLVLLASFFVFGLFITIILFVLLLLIGLYGAQDKLLFHPDSDKLQSRVFVLRPSIFGLPFENLHIKSLDGTLIHIYFIKQPDDIMKSVPTLLFLHGNAGNMGHRLHNAVGIYVNLKCNILMLEYRGYGMSKGSPSEKGMCMDAQAAIDFLMDRQDIDHCQIIVFGRSLGGAVAIDLCSRAEYSSKIWCLILENTFTSIPDMANTLFAWRILRYIPVIFYKNQFLSSMKIKGISLPTLLISGLNDNLVPPSMMVQLFQLCGSSEKQLVQVKQGSHNDTWTCPKYYSTISSFLLKMSAYKPDTPKPPSIVTDI